MSKLSAYSKYDDIDDASSDEEREKKAKETNDMWNKFSASSAPITNNDIRKKKMNGYPKNGRIPVKSKGTKMFEWAQTFEEVYIWIGAPRYTTSRSDLKCNIMVNHLQLGVPNYDRYFIDESTFGEVNTKESIWYWYEEEDGVRINEVRIVLVKARKGVEWKSALLGGEGVDGQGEN